MLANQQNRAQIADKMERRGLMKALDASQNLLWFDANGRIVDANRNVLNLLGYSADEILLHDFFDLTIDNQGQLLSQRRTWLRISTGDLVHNEVSFHGKDRIDVWASVNYAALRHDNGETRRVLAILIDLTKWAWKPSGGHRIAQHANFAGQRLPHQR